MREGDASEYAACADEDGAGGSDPLDSLCPAHVDSFVRSKRKSRWSHPGGGRPRPRRSWFQSPLVSQFFVGRFREAMAEIAEVSSSDLVPSEPGFVPLDGSVSPSNTPPFHWVAFPFSTWVRSPFRGPWEPTVLVSNHVADVVDSLAGVVLAYHGRWKRGGCHRKEQTCKGIPSHLPSRRLKMPGLGRKGRIHALQEKKERKCYGG